MTHDRALAEADDARKRILSDARARAMEDVVDDLVDAYSASEKECARLRSYMEAAMGATDFASAYAILHVGLHTKAELPRSARKGER